MSRHRWRTRAVHGDAGHTGRPTTPRPRAAILVVGCLLACGSGDPLAPDATPGPTLPTEAGSSAAQVRDLTIVESSPTTLTVRWTEVDDGRQRPASYRIKYAVAPLDWSGASIGCDPTLSGREVGAPMSCVIEGLAPGARYDVQAMSFRVEDGQWAGAVYSNVATGSTDLTSATPSTQLADGIWIGATEIAARPMSGPAWESLEAAARESCGPVDLSDQEQANDVCVMAKALVYARTGEWRLALDVQTALAAIANLSTYRGSALSLGRSLAAYVIAADVVDLAGIAPGLDLAFRSTLRELLTTPTEGGPANLVACHETRPNNWGTHCGASRAAIAAYLGDEDELARVAQVFRGWLGDRTAYAGFEYGDGSWQCDPDRPVGINPPGCTREGYDLGGVLPDDQRRGGRLSWPPPKENYVWEALQGALTQAVVLERAGFPAFEWQHRALLRAVTWLYQVADYPAEGDDTWQIHIVNHYYGSSFPAALPARPGKNVGWSDWTHGP